MIRRAHRDAAGGEHHVGPRRRGAEGRRRRGGIVAHDAEVLAVGAEPAQHRAQGVAVAVVERAGSQLLADHPQLVAGGEVGHPGAADDFDLRRADGGQQTQLRRPEPAAARQEGGTRGDVLAGGADVLAGALAGADADAAVVLRSRPFLHHYGIGAGRHHGAGHDAHALPGTDRARERTPGIGFAEQFQRGRRRRQVGAAHGIAVHRRVGGAGDVDRGGPLARQHSVERRRQRHGLALVQRPHGGPDPCPGLVGGDGLRVEVVLAAAAGRVHRAGLRSSTFTAPVLPGTLWKPSTSGWPRSTAAVRPLSLEAPVPER